MIIREHDRLYIGLDAEKSLVLLDLQAKAAFFYATDSSVLYAWSGTDWDAISGAGESNTGQNVGTGEGEVFKEKDGVDLQLRTLKEGDNITITTGTDEITISGEAGASVTGNNIGTGEGEVFKEIVSDEIRLRTLKAGSNVTISTDTDEVTINASGYALGERHVTLSLYAASSWDNEQVPFFQAPRGNAVTIKQVNAAVLGTSTPELEFNLEIRNWESLNTAGTDVFAANQTATATGLETTTFAEDGVGSKGYLVLTTPSDAESGVVGVLVLTVYYEV